MLLSLHPLVDGHLVGGGRVQVLGEGGALVGVGGLSPGAGRVWLDGGVAVQVFRGEEAHIRPQEELLHGSYSQTSLKNENAWKFCLTVKVWYKTTRI